MAKMAIVIVTWNTLDFLKQMVKSIRTKHDYTIIVVDNNSSDGIDDWMYYRMEEFPEKWHYIKHDRLQSTGANRNAGIKLARELDCSHIILSEEDVILHKGCIDNLLMVHEKNSFLLTAAVGLTHRSRPEAFFAATKPLRDFLGEPYRDHFSLNRVRRQSPEKQEQMLSLTESLIKELDKVAPMEIFDAPFDTVVCIRSDFVEKVGYYDEGYTVNDIENWDIVHRCHVASGRPGILPIDWENRKAWSSQLSLYLHWGGGSLTNNDIGIDWISVFGQLLNANTERYKKKWGGYVNHERWTIPRPQPSLWDTEYTFQKMIEKMPKDDRHMVEPPLKWRK